MTVSAVTPVIEYAADSTTTVFPYPFRILSAADIRVTLVANGVGTVVGSGFTVSGVGNNAGGNITFTTAPLAGNTIRIQRIRPQLRTTDYVEGTLDSDVVDNDFDSLQMQVQDIRVDVPTRDAAGNWQFGSKRLTNIAAPLAPSDAATVNYVLQTVEGLTGGGGGGGGGGGTVDWINIKDFGAVGNGIVDDTAAVQAAVTAAGVAPRRTIYVPAGTYLLTSGIVFNGRVSMIGDGMNNSTFQYTPTTGSAFSWSADGTYSFFEGIKVLGPGRTSGWTATGFTTFTGAACVFYMWDKCWIENFPLWGIDLNDSFNCTFTNGRLRRNGVRGTLAAGGTDGQGGGMRLRRITFVGAATTGNDYSNNYITGNHFGIKIEPSGNNNKAFNTRLDNCIFEENFIGLDLRNLGTGGRGRYQFLNTCYFEANLYAGAWIDEGTVIASYQNDTTPGTGVAPSWSVDGPDGVLIEGRYVEDRPSRFRVGNNAAAPYDESDNIAFAVDKNELTNYVSILKVRNDTGITLTRGAGSANVDDVRITSNAGNPEGVLTGNSGSLYLRRDGAGLSNILYVKTSDNSNTGWLSIGALQGPTSSRPAADATNKGVRYYDTDTLRSVVSNGSGVWREYNGLSSVKGTLANVPPHISGMRYYATDLGMTLQSDGGRWRQLHLPTRFDAVVNAGTTVISARGQHFVGTTTGAAVATHTLTLPSGTNAVSGDRVRFTVSNGVTALTVNAGTATVVNAPTTIAAGTTIEFIYNDTVTTWYRVL